MFVMASVELTLASSNFSSSVTGLGPEGPGSCPEIACSAVARAAGVGAGKTVGGADESVARPLLPVCPQTRPRLISRNQTDTHQEQSQLFSRLNFHELHYRDDRLFNATSFKFHIQNGAQHGPERSALSSVVMLAVADFGKRSEPRFVALLKMLRFDS